MIKVKTPLSPLELSIVSGIDDVQANHIKFHNISFCCDSIEDYEGRVFIQHKNGKWIPHSYEEDGRILLWECSECGNIIYAESKDDRSDFHNYCSECGADMRGKQDDNRRV